MMSLEKKGYHILFHLVLTTQWTITFDLELYYWLKVSECEFVQDMTAAL
jgi:hypothetical protein